MTDVLASLIDMSVLGDATMTVTCSSGSAVITIPGTRSYRLYQGDATHNTDDGTAPSLGGADCAGVVLKGLLDASSLSETFTVAFNPTTPAYTITPSSGNIAIAFSGTAGKLMRRIFGFAGNVSAIAAAVSTQAPWYWLSLPGKSNPTPRRVVPGAFRGSARMSSDGQIFGVAPARLPKGRQWVYKKVEREVALNEHGGAEAWTLERWYEYHAAFRRWLHFADGVSTFTYANREAVYALTEDGSNNLDPDYHVQHWDRLHDWPFAVVEHTPAAVNMP